MSGPTYIVITPVRDEAQYLPLTIASMAAQTLLPSQWVLVDDGSRDGTAELIDRAAGQYPWITAVHRADRGARKPGGGVIEAFYDGYRAIAVNRWDFIVKFDGDQSMAAGYFETCLAEFAGDPSLGIGGGVCCLDEGDGTPAESQDPDFHVRGATKIYRRACFEAIGGLMQATGWDTVDLMKANMHGWTTRTFPHCRLLHHRPTGAACGSWSNYVKNGLANYVTGYLPVFMVLKCLRRTLQRPHLQGMGLAYGYLKGLASRTPRVDPPVLHYVRTQQWRSLTFRQSLWNSTASPALKRSVPQPVA